jgi:uncharacterized protein YbaP (TraB family)
MQRPSAFTLARGLALGLIVVALSACKSEPKETPQPAEPAPSAEPAPPAAPAQAPGETPASEPAPARPTVAKPFLWEVSRKGAVSHVFGTIHAEYRLTDLPAVVTERLDAAKALVIETDVTAVSMTQVMQLAMLPPDQSLRTMLGEEYWAKLVAAVGKIMPAAALERVQPWFAGLLVSLGDLALSDPSQAMDMQIFQRARDSGKRVVFLEEAGEQLKMLSELGGLDDLKEALDEIEEVHAKLKDMLAAYGRGDVEALATITLDPEEMRERPEMMDKLLFARNRAWMKTLAPLLAEGGVFVAVGAGHFVGEQGLVTLLRGAGYDVKRIEP